MLWVDIVNHGLPLLVKTYWSQNAPSLPQGLRNAADGAEHQRAHNNIHGLVLHQPHVLPRRHNKPLACDVVVLGDAPLQIFLKVRVRVGADHLAAGRIKLKICARATTDLQKSELSAMLAEVRQTAKQLLFPVVHFLVVAHCDPVHAVWKEAFVRLVHAERFDQMKGAA